ncbi:MAG TPA: peptide chain release factor N(5)-glutamine methyltransferase [Candidatus Parabacteroides intestinipullorum]|uniref:Release factor glutamine methyltransferase n=1 Tax=Candidatus Parabacteroides intestinipullorum TaxID=2838723 RepID=A0A9D1X7C8_9BACT|nr:peptide chain release factor N(5)-glutamine methyltransferase [Candidatus Parabacteroides intestinipullorum]
MTETIARIRQALKTSYPDDEISAISRLILEHVCEMPFYKILLGKDKDLSDTQRKRIDKILADLQENRPIQQILGKEVFCGLSFKITPDVLIPRPETAELTYMVANDLKESPVQLLDIGTGSGCIAISLAHLLPQANVSAIDISNAALTVARENAASIGVKVDFKQLDLLEDKTPQALEQWLGNNLDAIISNPPYIMEKEKSGMVPNVLEHEPSIALFVPDNDPLLFYRTIAKIGKRLLKPDGILYFEINALCGEEMKEMLAREGYDKIEVRNDLYGKPRITKATNKI